jgi:hypothetical protein
MIAEAYETKRLPYGQAPGGKGWSWPCTLCLALLEGTDGRTLPAS